MYTVKKTPDGNYDLYKNGTVCRCPRVTPIIVRNDMTGQPTPLFFCCTSACALADVEETENNMKYTITCGSETKTIKLEAIETPNETKKPSPLISA